MKGRKKERTKGQKNKRLECKTHRTNYVNNRYYCTLQHSKSASFSHIVQSDHDFLQLNAW